MNALAFSNHLLSDVFALTAFLREARDRNAEKNVPAVLAAWTKAGQVLTTSGFPKFVALGQAIQLKAPQEHELVLRFSDWLAVASAQILPMLEEILQQEMIPDYQRAVVEATGEIAQRAAVEVAARHGHPAHGRGKMVGAFWRASTVALVGGANEAVDPTLPAVDPNAGAGGSAGCPACPPPGSPAQPGDPGYVQTARQQRRNLAHRYLSDWNHEALAMFGYYHPARWYNTGWMSQFGTGWRGFTCGYLNHLLNVEYPNTNLPHVIRAPVPHPTQVVPCLCEAPGGNEYLEQTFTFLGTVYWKALPALAPKLFQNATQSDNVAYAEVRVFVPVARLEWHWWEPWEFFHIGGAPGDFGDPVGDDFTGDDGSGDQPQGHWIIRRQPVPTHWDLINQHWVAQLAPATHPRLADVLQTPPPLAEFAAADLQLPALGGVSSADIGRISPH
jgi:hypothetical protein